MSKVTFNFRIDTVPIDIYCAGCGWTRQSARWHSIRVDYNL